MRHEVEAMLINPPPEWVYQFTSGARKAGIRGPLSLQNALKILGITAGGNRSNDTAYGFNEVPDEVREAALHGLRLSYQHNYGGWDFIGIARAIQLVVMPSVPDETLRRMSNYFSRHQKDKRGKNFGNESRPSRGYMAWLNWGGDPGWFWSSRGGGT